MLVFCVTHTPPPSAKVTPGFNHQSAQPFPVGSLTLSRFKSLVCQHPPCLALVKFVCCSSVFAFAASYYQVNVHKY